jgi:hypothetical protein
MKQPIRVFSILTLILFGTPVLVLEAFPQFQDQSSSYVTVKDGHFWLQGQRLYLHGVNYWPRYSLSLYDPKNPSSWWCYNYWISCDYRPQEVEVELQQIQKMGMNLIAIGGIDAWDDKSVSLSNLRDLLSRAKTHGLFVFLSQSFSYNFFDLPVDQAVEDYANRVATLNLSTETALLGYSIAWELNLGLKKERQHFDPEWTGWIISKYGSIQVAESSWNYQPFVYGSLAAPSSIVGCPEDQQLTSEGPWSKYTTDYWRFVYDWANSYFDLIVRAIKEVDPNHLVTIRNGYGGNGSLWANSHVPPDISVGADFLDFLSPEGYSLIGSNAETYEWQVAGLYCRMSPGKCGPAQKEWDNPTDAGFDFMVFPEKIEPVNQSAWPSPGRFIPSRGTVSGRVFRGDNGQPMVEVRIETCTGLDVKTDKDGYFEFPIERGNGFCVRSIVNHGRAVALNQSPSLFEGDAYLPELGFTTTYAKWATADKKPVVFMEFGRNIGFPIQQTLEAQKKFFQRFYEAALYWDVDGVVAWWYPGGPRLDEQSDYGVVNVNNSLRPVDDAIKWYASQVGQVSVKPIDSFLQIPFGIDDPLGYAGVYSKYLPRFRQLLTQGTKPAVRFTLRHTQITTTIQVSLTRTKSTTTSLQSATKSIESATTTSQLTAAVGHQTPIPDSYLLVPVLAGLTVAAFIVIRSYRRKRRQ